MLKRQEGFSKIPYRCTAGALTIGYGHNLDALGIPEYIALDLLKYDIGNAIRDLHTVLPELSSYSRKRQYALISMMFNLGLARFKKFTRMIEAIRAHDWILASDEAEESSWYKQVGQRGKEITELFRDG